MHTRLSGGIKMPQDGKDKNMPVFNCLAYRIYFTMKMEQNQSLFA